MNISIQHSSLYSTFIASSKAGPRVKQLVAQFIPKFFHHFPALAEQALNAQMDLCEDENVTVRPLLYCIRIYMCVYGVANGVVLQIRMYAIAGLGDLCKGAPAYVQRVADVLGQLLVTGQTRWVLCW